MTVEASALSNWRVFNSHLRLLIDQYRNVVLWSGLSIICLTAAVAIFGCTTIGQHLLEQPKLSFGSVGIRDIRSDGVTVLFGLQVENPNPISITVDALRYDVEIGGKLISSSKIDKSVSVPAHGKNIVEIPVPVKYTDLLTSLTNLFGNGSTSYHLKGEAKVSLFTLPFDQKGDLKIR